MSYDEAENLRNEDNNFSLHCSIVHRLVSDAINVDSLRKCWNEDFAICNGRRAEFGVQSDGILWHHVTVPKQVSQIVGIERS